MVDLERHDARNGMREGENEQDEKRKRKRERI